MSKTIATIAEETPREFTGGKYQVEFEDGKAIFWDAETPVFAAPERLAATQEARDELADVFEAGRHRGYLEGRRSLKTEFKRLLDL
ncbi:hypothetical protein [Roseibium sp. Sym1]|uniref:hypothetical protein n=1 Tax=Roseibium sp. Sym1 TaxID=3016006 RepID=UPI0022B3E43A|nr:hypothetical protein [Roseibium sp. Sym1]